MKRTATIVLILLLPFLCAQAQALRLHEVKKVYIQEAFAPIDQSWVGRDFLPSLLQWLQIVAVREEADAILDVHHRAEEQLSIFALFTHVSKGEATLIDVKTKGAIWKTKKEAREKVVQPNDGQYFKRTEAAVDQAIAEQLRKDWEQSAHGIGFRSGVGLPCQRLEFCGLSLSSHYQYPLQDSRVSTYAAVPNPQW